MVVSKSPVQHHGDGLSNDVLQPDYEAHDRSSICTNCQSVALASCLRNDFTCIRSPRTKKPFQKGKNKGLSGTAVGEKKKAPQIEAAHAEQDEVAMRSLRQVTQREGLPKNRTAVTDRTIATTGETNLQETSVIIA